MDLKQRFMNKAFELMQDPRVAKAVQNPRVMQTLLNALKLRSQLEQNLDKGVKVVAKRLHLATESEVRELRRAVHRLERELDQVDQVDKQRGTKKPSARNAGHAGNAGNKERAPE